MTEEPRAWKARTRGSEAEVDGVIRPSTVTRYGCYHTVAVQVLDVSAGSPLRRHGWPASGPLCGSVARQTLRPKDHLLSADEKTSIQAHRRGHPSLHPAPHRAAYIENEYERGRARQYLAAWDVRRGG